VDALFKHEQLMLRYRILSSAVRPRDIFPLRETERPIWISRLGDSCALESFAPELDIEIYHGAAIGPNHDSKSKY
jgi:hypothetical protein